MAVTPLPTAARDVPNNIHTKSHLRPDSNAVLADNVSILQSHDPVNLLTPPSSVSPAPVPAAGSPATGTTTEAEKQPQPPNESGTTALSAKSLAALDSVVSSRVLAIQYLPQLLESQGPLSIHEMVSFLMISVPGFSRLAPLQARYLILDALASKNPDGSPLELPGQRAFDAHPEGFWGLRSSHQPPTHPHLAAASSSMSRTQPTAQSRYNNSHSSEDIPFAFTYDELNHPRGEFDHMTLDGPGDASCSEATDDDVMIDDEDDATDDEDWDEIGAAALRAGSYQSHDALHSLAGTSFRSVASQMAALRTFSVTSGSARSPQLKINPNSMGRRDSQQTTSTEYLTPLSAMPDAQERDAIEALLKLGSFNGQA